jgi:hypothetical protein
MLEQHAAVVQAEAERKAQAEIDEAALRTAACATGEPQ